MEQQQEEPGVTESTNNAVYKNDRGCRSVPLVLLFQRFIYIYNLLPLTYTPRGCLVPAIPPEHVAWFSSQGFYARGGYWCVSVGGTTVGLHALYWVYTNYRHPDEGMPF